jgi:hypothetical protein
MMVRRSFRIQIRMSRLFNKLYNDCIWQFRICVSCRKETLIISWFSELHHWQF